MVLYKTPEKGALNTAQSTKGLEPYQITKQPHKALYHYSKNAHKGSSSLSLMAIGKGRMTHLSQKFQNNIQEPSSSLWKNTCIILL